MIFSWDYFPKQTWGPERPTILNVAREIFLSGRYIPSKSETYCNFAVSAFFLKFGYKGFGGKLANQIILEACTGHDFTECPKEAAQGLVNRGYLVFAGLQSVPHGHVVIILPGPPMPSRIPGKFSPICMDIGRSYCFGRSTETAFKSEPRFFVFNEITGG